MPFPCAVTRRPCAPRVTPARTARAISSGVSPPSGPISTSRRLQGAGSVGSVVAASGASTIPARAPRAVTQPDNGCTSCTAGTRLRPHCSHAALRDLSPVRKAPVAALAVGKARAALAHHRPDRAAPISTALRTTKSVVSLAAIACTSVTASGESRSIGSNASRRTHALRLSARTSVAANSPPVAGEERQRIADPRRSTRSA